MVLSSHGATSKRKLICKKLVCVLVNASWINSHPQSHCTFDAGGCLDHLCCKIQIKMSAYKPRKPFKFSNALASLYGFLPLVWSFWAGTDELMTSTSALYRLSKKLKALKSQIRKLSKETMGDLQIKTKHAYEDLCLQQNKTLADPNSDHLKLEAQAYSHWKYLSDLEERFLRKNRSCIGYRLETVTINFYIKLQRVVKLEMQSGPSEDKMVHRLKLKRKSKLKLKFTFTPLCLTRLLSDLIFMKKSYRTYYATLAKTLIVKC